MNINSLRRLLSGIAAAGLGLTLGAGPAWTAPPDTPLGSFSGPLSVPTHLTFTQPDPQQMRWASRALAEMQTVRVGMTRAQMSGIFTRAGGAYAARATAPLIGVYSLRTCPYFKVNVEFQPVHKPQRDKYGSVWTPEDPKDVITKISKPYLEQVYYD